jgi:sugar phosphate permease
LVTGFTLAATGLALLVRLSPTTGYVDVVLPSILLIGAGMGAAFVTMTSSAVAGVPREDAGVASALLNASQQIGGSLGLAVLTAVATARFDAVRPIHPTPASVASATTSSWVWGFVVAAVLLLAAAVVAGILVRVRRQDLAPDEPVGGENEMAEAPVLAELELTSASTDVSLVDGERSRTDAGAGPTW